MCFIKIAFTENIRKGQSCRQSLNIRFLLISNCISQFPKKDLGAVATTKYPRTNHNAAYEYDSWREIYNQIIQSLHCHTENTEGTS